MTQPTFAMPCEYGFTVQRQSYGARMRLSTTVSGATPSNDEWLISAYEIKTVPIANDTAEALDNSLRALRGSYFFSRFYFDDRLYKYRIVDDQWEWQVIGPTANVFTLRVERLNEPSIEIPIDYGQSQNQQLSANLFRISATVSGATTASAIRKLKRVGVQTRAMSRDAAVALDQQFVALNGSSFYSQLYLDTSPTLYKLQPYEWQWTPEGEDAYVCAFTLAEVPPNTTDIACTDSLSLERTLRTKNVQFGDGYQQVIPDGINNQDYAYSIETLPLSDAQAASLDAQLAALNGNIFYSKFKNDSQAYKYRLDGNRWSWNSEGKDANVFSFKVKRAYDL